MRNPFWLSENLHMHGPADALQELTIYGALPVVGETMEVNLVPGRQVPQLVERTNPFTLVGWVWEAVRKEENLHSL
jgi:hypothetical protein